TPLRSRNTGCFLYFARVTGSRRPKRSSSESAFLRCQKLDIQYLLNAGLRTLPAFRLNRVFYPFNFATLFLAGLLLEVRVHDRMKALQGLLDRKSTRLN